MKILFLDQSGEPGGAELCLIDIAKSYRDSCLVGLLTDGSFRNLLEQEQIPVKVFATESIQICKDSTFIEILGSVSSLIPLIAQVAQTARDYDLIYANTQKALGVGAIASFIARRPLVYHLHDILSADHFSLTNRRIIVTLANHFASVVIANSKATRTAFIKAGGRANLTKVVYNGFDPDRYRLQQSCRTSIRLQLGLEERFIVGHFSRLSPWKGQHILLEALTRCPSDVIAIFVGDALFGERDYVERLHRQVAEFKLEERVRFLGFRSDVVSLMGACDLVAHTSIAPEPFGRVIVEAMLCGRPIVAAAAGGAIELIEQSKTGWLVTPADSFELANTITMCRQKPGVVVTATNQARLIASERFHLSAINRQLTRELTRLIPLSRNTFGRVRNRNKF